MRVFALFYFVQGAGLTLTQEGTDVAFICETIDRW